ncbi:hypothetical protein L3Q82_026893 [Scortum barcoo]|uniref:Uncharacterized protein n=1 Tax=Scortum barcoo TaxID=214431 RepID=A0ACB8WN19_9TELE|nr:hypothetical protein L3Q82_026893 [Scortum barcoo]
MMGKEPSFFKLMKLKKVDVMLIQETHSYAEEIDWRRGWDGEVILSHRSSCSGGVGVVFSRSFLPSSYDTEEIIKGSLLKGCPGSLRASWFLPEEKGGQGLVHLASRRRCLSAFSSLQRLLTGPADLVLEAFILAASLQRCGGLRLGPALFLMDCRSLDTSSLPAFYRSVFSVWILLRKQRREQADSLYWLLQEPGTVWRVSGLSQLEWTHFVQTTENCRCFHSGADGWSWRDPGWMILLDWLLSWD